MKNRRLIHARIRHTVVGTADRPRLAVYRSLNNIFAQLIDDQRGRTLAAASSLKMTGPLTAKAQTVGQAIAAEAKKQKLQTAVFDRGGFTYSGAVQVLANAAREEGLTI